MENEHPKEDYGPVFPRTYDKCPGCHCPARFTVEAARPDFSVEDFKKQHPILAYFSHEYELPLHTVRLVVVVDSCQRCGLLYTVARDKVKKLKGISVPSKQRPPFPPFGHG